MAITPLAVDITGFNEKTTMCQAWCFVIVNIAFFFNMYFK